MKVNIGKGIELDINVGALPQAAREHVEYIGLRNILMDSHASVTSETENYVELSRAQAEKKLAALMAGEIRVAGTREGDPVRAESIRLATLAVKAQLRKKGVALSNVDPKAIRAKAVEFADKFRAQAEKNVADSKAAEVDLGDLI